MRDVFTRKVDFRRRGRQSLATAITLTLLNLLAMVGHGTPKPAPDSTIGRITTLGVVKINGSPVTLGQTLFSGCSIVTAAESESTLVLANLTRLKLDQETSLTLQSAKLSFSASLDKGVMRALTPSGLLGEIRTPDAVITTDPGHQAAFTVLVEACSTNLIVQTGRVEIRAGDYVRTVSGERFSTDAGPAPPSMPPPHLSNRKKAGLFLGIGGAIAILLIALTGREKAAATDTPGGGCVIILSPTAGGGGCS